MSTTPEIPAKLYDLRGNAPLVLNAPDVVWRVHTGTIAVFAVCAVEGVTAGPRRYLFSCNPGDLLFGSRTSHDTGDLAFLAVGLDNVQLEECARSALPQSNGSTAQQIGPRLEAWIRRVSSLLVDSKPVHAEKAPSDGQLTLSAGQSLKPSADKVLWVHVQSGRVSLGGREGIEAGPGWLPLADPLQLSAEEDAVVAFLTTDQLESWPALCEGMDRLHETCFRFLQQLEREEAEQEAERLTQLKRRQARDTTAAIDELSSVLNRTPERIEKDDLMGALAVIGKQLGLNFRRPENDVALARAEDPVEAIARASRIRARRVQLYGRWYREDAGPILAYLHESGRAVALLREQGHYVLYDATDGSRRRVTRAVGRELAPVATTFVRPLPDDAASLWSLGRFALRPVRADMSLVIFLSLAITLLGMLVPVSTQLVIDQAIPDANLLLLYQLAAGLLAMSLGQAALAFSQKNILLRADTATTAGLQAAVIDRLVRLPTRFFRNYSSGDLQNRALMVTQISHSVGHAALGGILTGGMATLNLALCFYYSRPLAILALISALVVASYTAGLSALIRNTARQLAIGQGHLFGLQVQLVSGVSKLRVAGAEQRAFNHWARRQAEQLRLMSSVQRIEQWGSVINAALMSSSTIVLYFFAAMLLASHAAMSGGMKSTAPALLTIGTFLAFYAAFTALILGMTGLSGTLVELMDSFAKRKMITPLVEEKPENDDTKVHPGRLEGAMAINSVTFRYREDGPLVLSEISLHANPGEFIGIVGPSGCGKSTLLRIMLGFESPSSGTVTFDGQDLSGLDGPAVRRQIGVVLQSGVVNSGSIFDNIAGASRVTLEEAWAAAHAAGLAKDIEQMPMSMHTYLSEGGGTLSGGQRQRLLIARALVHRPKILIFDEATSALDNRTQQIVSDSIDRRQVTRIVVAHRLSTIRDASRIYVMEGGKVVQSGAYSELSQEEGLFQRMIARQLA